MIHENHLIIEKGKALKNMLAYSNLVAELSRPLFTRFGVNNFIYNEFHTDGGLLVLNSNAKFLEEKTDIGFIERLPRVILNDFKKPGFHIQDWISDKEASRYLKDDTYHELAQNYDYAHPLRYFEVEELNEKKIIRQFVVYTPHNQKDSNYNYINYRDEFLTFFEYFIERFATTLKAMKRIPVNIDSNIAMLSPQTCKPLKKMKDILSAYRSIGVSKCTQAIKLSDKERSVLAHFFKGLSAKEIADRLYVSKRTVECHLQNLRQRFDCNTTQEVVYKILKKGVLLSDEF